MDIEHVDLSIDENNLCEGALKLLKVIRKEWDGNDINCEIFKDGFTNKLVACFREKDVVLVRVYGKNTSLLIDRAQEKQIITLLSTIDCARPLYCSFNNGIAYGFAPGRVLRSDDIFDLKIQKLVAKEMVKMHSFNLEKSLEKLGGKNLFDSKPNLFNKISWWISKIPADSEMPSGWSIESIKNEVEELQKHLILLNSPTVFCHNDLLPKNIIYDKEMDKISFVDFEYAFPNYQAFDIGNFFCEFAGMEKIDYNLYPKEDFQKAWLKEYLKFYKGCAGEGDVTQAEIDIFYVQVNKFALASHLFWAIWGIVQHKNSTLTFDYLEFSELRLKEYLRRKPDFLALKMPSP